VELDEWTESNFFCRVQIMKKVFKNFRMEWTLVTEFRFLYFSFVLDVRSFITSWVLVYFWLTYFGFSWSLTSVFYRRQSRSFRYCNWNKLTQVFVGLLSYDFLMRTKFVLTWSKKFVDPLGTTRGSTATFTIINKRTDASKPKWRQIVNFHLTRET